MPETVLLCPLCEGSRSTLFDRRTFRGQVITNCLCLTCGLVFQSPRMTTGEAEAFYEQEYRVVYEGSPAPTLRNLADQRGRAESLLNFTVPIVPEIETHLDIGCSTGVLLQHFDKKFRCKSTGVEPNDAHRANAINSGLEVYASLNDLEAELIKRFDLISMSHVVEHLPDPVEYLAHLREVLLNSEGWLLVEVPNLYAHDSFEIAHLVSYSRHSLGQTLSKAGFEIVKMEQHGRPRSIILPLYISVLARPNKEPEREFVLQPEKMVSLKRKAGMLRRRVMERLFPRQAWLPNLSELKQPNLGLGA